MVSDQTKLKLYYLTAVFSLIFSLLGFSYNAWRMEVSEDNSNIREAAFEVLKELGELEQIVYALHYDHDQVNGSPRKGWVKVGLIQDLSVLISVETKKAALELKKTWSENWSTVETKQASNDDVIDKIEYLRHTIKLTLLRLK